MDSKYKALLQCHRPFLTKNIVWCSELSDQLKAQGLVTDFMIKDINSCGKREDQVNLLIDLIPLKSNSAFHKFLDVLMLTGHVFIADFLKEDEDHQKLFDAKEMYKALPFVQRAFNDSERKAIETYVTERIENQVLKLLWKRQNTERDKALEAQMKQIEQSYEFEEHFRTKSATINTLEKEITASLENKVELKAKISALTNAHREMEVKHKEAMEIQMRYNAANDSTIDKSRQTISNMENLLHTLHSQMDTELKRNTQDFPLNYGTVMADSSKKNNNNKGKHQENHKQAEKKAKDLEIYKDKFGFVLDDLENLISRYRYLLDIKIRYDRLQEEKEYILIHFGHYQNEADKQKAGVTLLDERESSLVNAYKDFVTRNDEHMDQMKKRLEEYDGLLEENKAKLEDLTKEKDEKNKKLTHGASVWQGAIMNVMRKQLQDMKSDSRKKESMMAIQEEEMAKLKNRISELEHQLSSLHSQPDSLSVGQSRDTLDGRVSAISCDSVELIQSDTPKPARNKNLPPLKSSKLVGHKAGSSSPRGTVMRSSKVHVMPAPKSTVTEPAKNYITFPMAPITTPIRPDVRGRPMGSVLGDLKAMNKHHTRPFADPKPAWKQNGSASIIK